MTPGGTSQWRDATRERPCPICDHPDWCSISVDGGTVVCRRQSGGRHKVDRAGNDCWIYRLNGRPAPASLPEPTILLAEEETRDRVYHGLLDVLDLSKAHRTDLRNRGLSDDEIDRRGYRTLPGKGRPDVAQAMDKQFARDTLVQVPGFYIGRTRKKTFLAVSGVPGLLIPVRDLDGRIIALRIRIDESRRGGKYRHFSSAHQGGPTPGTNIHIPLNNARDTSRVRITEGELKADVCAVLDPEQVFTVAIQGVGTRRALKPLLKKVKARTVRLAIDSDARTNRHVAAAQKSLGQALCDWGYQLEVDRW